MTLEDRLLALGVYRRVGAYDFAGSPYSLTSDQRGKAQAEGDAAITDSRLGADAVALLRRLNAARLFHQHAPSIVADIERILA